MSRELGESYDRLYSWFAKRRRYEAKVRRYIKTTEQIVSHPPRCRRFSAAAKRELKARYDDNRYPTRDELEQMSQIFDETYKRLYDWFANRRTRERQEIQALGIQPHPLLEHLRPRISSAVTEALEAIYARNHYPTYEELEKMAQELGESHERLNTWFWWRRTKEKKVIKATGMEEQLGEFRAFHENRTYLKQHWTRLEAAFQQDLFPTVEQQKLLAAELMVPYLSVVSWLRKRRTKEGRFGNRLGLILVNCTE
ncbi:hypothetical protein CPB85DRAFT_374621 [Mucidula mucida]|nr:hypothetical protein CPB85DRAFT_374621 [Mucidula mucida]